jgi:predicted CoA-binding protein
MKMLAQYGHDPVPVAPKHKEIQGKTVYPSLAELPGDVDTVTLYLGVPRQENVIDQIIDLKPKRVIFNPGTENPAAYDRLRQAGIRVQEACTLVLLKTGQYDVKKTLD